jgi:hypothetical protein
MLNEQLQTVRKGFFFFPQLGVRRKANFTRFQKQRVNKWPRKQKGLNSLAVIGEVVCVSKYLGKED